MTQLPSLDDAHSFWTSSSSDVPAGVTQEEDHTRFLIHLLSAMRALIFIARRVQPFLSRFTVCSDFSLNTFSEKKKKTSKLRVEPSSPQLLGFQSSRGSRRNKKAINNRAIIVSLINPDFEKQKKTKIVVGRNRTTVNAIVRVSIYHRLYSDGTRDLARFARGF